MATTTNLSVTKIDSAQAQKEVTANEAFDVFDAALSELAVAMTDADYTLSTSTVPQEWQYGVINLTGTLTAGRNLIVPINKKQYVVYNNTTGGFAVTVKTSGGTGIAVTNTKTAILRCDGTNVAAITPGAGVGSVTSVGVSSTDLSVSGSPVTTSGSITLNINNDAVTYAKIQNVSATDKILGRSTSGAGDIEEIACTSFARSILDDTDAATVRATIGAGTGSGTVTSVGISSTDLSVSGSPVTGSGSITLNVANDAITYAKIQNVSATDKILGRSSSGSGDIEEITCTSFARSILDDADAATVRATIDAASSTQPFCAAFFYPGVPTASVCLMELVAPSGITTITFAAAISGSSGKSLTAATAQTDFDVRKNATTNANGTSVGTIRFAAAGTVPTFIAASGFTLTGGSDWLTIWGPASPDATLANIGVTLYGTR